MTIIDEIVENGLGQKVSKAFGFVISSYSCNICGRNFETLKGAKIHITKKHNKGRLNE